MPVSMGSLTADLAAESAVLRALLAPLTGPDWRRATPAAGWCIADQITHLAHFDEAAVRSATDPEAFRAELAAGPVNPDAVARRHRALPPEAVLAWFNTARSRLVEVYGGLAPGVRVPWYGPAMSAASSVTARIMETWAHGQDVADALGAVRTPTDRLRHVAHLGIGALPYSFTVNGRPVPQAPVRVELVAPSGARWSWGPSGAADRVAGTALDFCLLVTQRRHRDDTALAISGPVATEWMSFAQAFAGPAGPGRRPTPGEQGPAQ